MTNKELIQAFRECQRHPQCDGCELGDKPDNCCVIESLTPYEVINRLEALLAENVEMNIQIQKEICKRVDVEAENDHLREATKMVPRWVSVSERLPDKSWNYLAIACDEGAPADERIWGCRVVVVADYSRLHNTWTWDENGTEYDLTGLVTHWMPLPSTEGVE